MCAWVSTGPPPLPSASLGRFQWEDPYHFDAGPDPDPDRRFDVDADPDPTFHFDADLDPDPTFQINAQNLKVPK